MWQIAYPTELVTVIVAICLSFWYCGIPHIDWTSSWFGDTSILPIISRLPVVGKSSLDDGHLGNEISLEWTFYCFPESMYSRLYFFILHSIACWYVLTYGTHDGNSSDRWEVKNMYSAQASNCVKSYIKIVTMWVS